MILTGPHHSKVVTSYPKKIMFHLACRQAMMLSHAMPTGARGATSDEVAQDLSRRW